MIKEFESITLRLDNVTLLDAKPQSWFDKLVKAVALFFNTSDLKSACHQVLILQEGKHYNAFEACGQLSQSLTTLWYV